MHKFITTSGKELWYDMNTNRISLWNPSKDLQAYPVVSFSEPQGFKTEGLTLFTIEMSQQCNLRCSYCCYSGSYRDRRTHRPKEISYVVLDRIVQFIMDHADMSSEEITVCFYGGEALLAKTKIQYLIEKLVVLFGDRVCFSLSTNGLALTEPTIDWICGHEKFWVNITIDGNEDMHDAHRVQVNGKGSYKTIISNLSTFKNKYPNEYNKRVRFLSTVYSLKDVEQLSAIWNNVDVLEQHLPVHISHIIPNSEDVQRVYDTKEIKDDFYSKAFEEYKLGKNTIMTSYLNKLISIVEKRSLTTLLTHLRITTCYQDMFSCFVNVDGDLYPCEKFCDTYKIGDVYTGFDEQRMTEIQRNFTNRKNKFCHSCWAQRFCRMCLTGLNHTDQELVHMCEMERDTIELSLKYFCEMIDWKNNKIKDKRL